jgi:hypothetical protein
MNSRQKKTLAAIFEMPTRKNIPWRDIESLFVAVGADIIEGSGSRVRVRVNKCHADFHRPHPGKIAAAYQVEYARSFLSTLGIKP